MWLWLNLSIVLLLGTANGNFEEIAPEGSGSEEGLFIPKVYGGRKVKKGEFLSGIYLEKDGEYVCTFTIISTMTAIGAAHCVYRIPPRRLTGTIGNINYKKGWKVYFSAINIHYSHQAYHIAYDLATLYFSKELQLSKRVQPIALIGLNAQFDNVDCTFYGWGSVSKVKDRYPKKLRKVNLNVQTYQTCGFPQPNLICATKRNKGVTNGDSGGPLVITFNDRPVVIGILGGYHMGQPNTFVALSYFLHWIRDHVRGNVTFVT